MLYSRNWFWVNIPTKIFSSHTWDDNIPIGWKYFSLWKDQITPIVTHDHPLPSDHRSLPRVFLKMCKIFLRIHSVYQTKKYIPRKFIPRDSNPKIRFPRIKIQIFYQTPSKGWEILDWSVLLFPLWMTNAYLYKWYGCLILSMHITFLFHELAQVRQFWVTLFVQAMCGFQSINRSINYECVCAMKIILL